MGPDEQQAADTSRSIPLEAELRRVRALTIARANTARLALRLAGLALAGWGACTALVLLCSVLFQPAVEYSTRTAADVAAYAAERDHHMLLVGYGVAAGLLVGAYGLIVFVSAPRIFGYHYRLAWQRFLHEHDRLLYADEERMQVIQQRLARTSGGLLAANPQFASVGLRLEFAAYQLPGLRALAQGARRVSQGELDYADLARRNARLFNEVWSYVLLFAVGALAVPLHPLLALAHLVLVALGLGLGPRTIQASARLAAFIDCYLDEPQLDTTRLGPAVEQHGWLSQTTAPWFIPM